MMALSTSTQNPSDTAAQLHQSLSRLLRVLRAGPPAEGITTAGIGVLGCLYRRGQATATDLAAYLRVQPQTLTRLLADLEKRKWITRRPDPMDGRRNLLELTNDGAGILIENIHSRQALLARAIAEGLTPAEQNLLGIAAVLMDKLTVALDEYDTATGLRG